ncbi:histone-like nucleoid-structuring protein Lsr2 [Brevibacterium permense]|uniref:histone-like nucleoid-structuring protein Lsr2 n=1 Tax=Brevibacterium permense TaxID=234834 RepID=UPI0021CE3D27|nr:Lsr2 family protein [Brevibacterium permense]
MARKLIEHIYDDLDGTLISDPSEGRTVTFAIDRTSYAIDLTTAHAEELEENLRPFTRVARAVRSSQTKSRIRDSWQGRGDLEGIRKWARDNDYGIYTRGRIPTYVVEAYDNAH